MACFSASLEQLIIETIIIGAIFAIIRPLVPAIGGLFGGAWRLKIAKPSVLTTLMTVSCPWAGRPVAGPRGVREIKV
jgi:hypothetical protein